MQCPVCGYDVGSTCGGCRGCVDCCDCDDDDFDADELGLDPEEPYDYPKE